jgi:hypothetical protein
VTLHAKASSKVMRVSELYSRAGSLMAQVTELIDEFHKEGLPVPEPMQAWVDHNSEPAARKVAADVNPVAPPPMPRIAQEGWIWVPVANASASTLASGVLKTSGKTMFVSELIAAVGKRRKGISDGTLYNAVARLAEEGEMSKNGEFVSPLNPAAGPVIEADFVWGDPKVLQGTDVSWHRRMLISHALGQTGGLTIMEIVRTLETLTKAKLSLNKDSIKSDLVVMARSGSVVKEGRTWKSAP